jgi:hypothetical protein
LWKQRFFILIVILPLRGDGEYPASLLSIISVTDILVSQEEIGMEEGGVLDYILLTHELYMLEESVTHGSLW